MSTDPMSRGEIERLLGNLGDCPGDTPMRYTAAVRYTVGTLRRLLGMALHSLSEPTRIAAARAEGYREGGEEAAAWVDREAANCEALGAKVLAGDYRHIAASLRSLIPSPAPIEPSAPVAPELAERLRSTTEEMANRASVPMDLWGRHSNACLDAVARITALEAESAALREDAERWRAFFSSERFSVMGWTGFTLDMQNPQIDPSRDRGLHFGLNVWDRHPGSEEEDAQGTHGRKFLLAYVDHMVRARALLQGQEPAAAGTVGDGR